MANEVTNASMVSNGGRVAELMAPQLHQSLWDPTDLRALMTRIPFPGAGSAVTSIVKVPAPPTAAAVSSETSGGTSNTALTTGEAQLTLACQQVQIQPTDLFAITGGALGIPESVAWLSNSVVGLRLTDMLCALFPSLATSVGSGSGDNMHVDTFWAAKYGLNLSNVPGAGTAMVLGAKSMNEFVESLRAEGGFAQFNAATPEIAMIRGPGYQGEYMGVQIYQSDSVTTSGGAVRNAMFGTGCFAYQLGPIGRLVGLTIPAANVMLASEDLIVEMDRDATNNMTTYFAKFYAAVTEVEDLRGVLINVDA